MPNPEIAIAVHSPPDHPAHPSEDFELVHYPTHASADWQPSHRKEELPYYMTDDTSARRRVTHNPQAQRTPQQQNAEWVDEYDAEGKDVYAKASTFQRYGHGGRIPRRGPPPPPTSIVRRRCLHTLLCPHNSYQPCPYPCPLPPFSASS